MTSGPEVDAKAKAITQKLSQINAAAATAADNPVVKRMGVSQGFIDTGSLLTASAQRYLDVLALVTEMKDLAPTLRSNQTEWDWAAKNSHESADHMKAVDPKGYWKGKAANAYKLLAKNQGTAAQSVSDASQTIAAGLSSMMTALDTLFGAALGTATSVESAIDQGISACNVLGSPVSALALFNAQPPAVDNQKVTLGLANSAFAQLAAVTGDGVRTAGANVASDSWPGPETT